MDKVLAKSRRTLGDGTIAEITLAKHTQDVIDAAKALFGDAAPTFVAEQWLRFFRIPNCWPRFHRNLIAACALHDWGKANDSFQKALTGACQQAIRHEHLSALLIAMPNVRSWLKSAEIDVPLVLSAVLTHHLKAADTVSGFAQKLAAARFRLVNDDDGFQQTLDIAASHLGIAPLSFGDLPVSWTFDSGKQSVRDLRTIVQDNILEPYEQSIKRNEQERRLLLAVRSALIVADAAGSGIVRAANSSVVTWIQESVTHRPVLTRDQIHEAIIEKRRQQMVSSGQWHDWNDFQLACDHLPERALLLAPCGSGKTLAAWRWIAAQLAKRPAGHAIFLYPTRATAREGFQDYVSWAPETDAALMHGTSEFDLDGMFENAPDNDERRDKKYLRESERRLFALAYWPRRVFSATVDQFLAFMQYSYGPMCMLPVLTNSILVIDEVHSFDNNMFSALKDFLKAFDIPVLCMTATLPETRRRDLVETCGLAAPPEWPADLQEVADRPRYRFMHVADRETAESSVRTALAEGKRVLWVVNQVKRAHDIVRSFVHELPDDDETAAALTTTDGVPVVCYHSRFCLRDRVARHSETMKYLKATHTGAALGVTTQVCEMSLDIDVDLLVTEECPVPSMVQRMGRCNRNRNARSLATSGHVVVYPPENNENLPYDRNDLAGLPEFLKHAEGRDLSQSDLDDIMSVVPCPAAPGDKLSRFLESGAYAVGPRDDGGEGFRDTNEFSRQCVLQQDIAKYLSTSRKEQPGFIVPIPNRRILGGDEFSAAATGLPSWLFVAPNENYHRAVGFLDRPASEWSSSI